MDGVDACLACLDGPTPQLVATYHRPYSPELLQALRKLSSVKPNGHVSDLGCVDAWLGEYLAETVLTLLAQAEVEPEQVRAIGSHGQTLWHAPWAPWPHTLQIGDPHRIAERTGIPVVADFRRRDIAAGGQGAPLVPPAHAGLFAHAQEARVVANLGGIANITILPEGGQLDGVLGFDTGPGNTLLDAWIRHQQGLAFDRDGAWAASGQVQTELLAALLDDPYFSLPFPKSTGPEYFNLDWLERRAQGRLYTYAPQDVQATLLELTAESLLRAIRATAPQTARLLVCGGGAYNHALMQRLKALAQGIKVESTAYHGVEPAWVEALAFAWLAKQMLDGQPGNLPQVTGARGPRVLGALYPGARPMPIPIKTGASP